MAALPGNWRTIPNAQGFSPPDSVTPIIVCAACRSPCGLLACSSRHFSPAMHTQIAAAGVSSHDVEQGFIDQFDRFWTREQAYEIMTITGQPMLHAGEWGEELYSENLY